jgi:hypothetical protein
VVSISFVVLFLLKAKVPKSSRRIGYPAPIRHVP